MRVYSAACYAKYFGIKNPILSLCLFGYRLKDAKINIIVPGDEAAVANNTWGKNNRHEIILERECVFVKERERERERENERKS